MRVRGLGLGLGLEIGEGFEFGFGFGFGLELGSEVELASGRSANPSPWVSPDDEGHTQRARPALHRGVPTLGDLARVGARGRAGGSRGRGGGRGVGVGVGRGREGGTTLQSHTARAAVSNIHMRMATPNASNPDP